MRMQIRRSDDRTGCTEAMAVLDVLAVLCFVVSAVESVTLEPATDSVVATNSDENVTYTCRSEEDSLRWVVNEIPVSQSDAQALEKLAEIGVQTAMIAPGHLSLAMGAEGREARELSISCMTYRDPFGRFGSDQSSHTFLIISYDSPDKVESLELVYYSQTQLRLQWSRPEGTHPPVPMWYTVTMTNSHNGDTKQMFETNDTQVLVDQREDGDCRLLTFTVVPANEAGSGPPTNTTQNIPLSPIMTEIEDSQKVEGVTLFGGNGVNASVTFKPAQVCNVKYPVLYYTLDITGVDTLNRTASESTDPLRFNLSSQELPALARGNAYSATIGACSEFTCRYSSSTLAVYTADVIEVSVAVHDRSVSVRCTLAAGSSATACMVVFTRFSDGETETFYTTSPTAECPQLAQTRGAYLAEAQVYTLIDGEPVLQPLNASIEDAQKDDYKFSCELVTTSPPSSLSEGELAATIAVPTVVIIAIAIVIVVVGVVLWFKKFHNGNIAGDGIDGVPLQVPRYEPLGGPLDISKVTGLDSSILEKARQCGTQLYICKKVN